MSEEKKPSRHLTQRYDMHALHAIQRVEEKLQAALGDIYGCDPDDLPCEIDTLEIFNQPAAVRREMIMKVLSGAPKDVTACVNVFLDELQALEHDGAKPVIQGHK